MWAYYLVQRYLKFLNLFKFNLKILERFFWGMNLLELKIQVSSFSEFSWKYPKITHQSFGFFAKLMCRLINILKATSYFRSYKIIFLCNLNLIVLFCLFSEFQTRRNIKFKQKISKLNCKCIFDVFKVLKICSEFTWKFSGQPEITGTCFS